MRVILKILLLMKEKEHFMDKIVILIVATTSGGSVGYIDASAIPSVLVLYVGITNISNLRIAI
jgi:hypothetical protein